MGRPVHAECKRFRRQRNDLIKSGPDAGKPTQLCQFGLGGGGEETQAHFANEPGWGQLAWATAHAAFPGGDKSVAMSRDFSWKIEDGDSKTIGVKSKSKIPPCDREGYKGCWIIRFSSSFAPKIYDARDPANPVILDTPGAVVPGYYVQVVGTMAGNTGKSPGIYINHGAVGLRAYGAEIKSAGVDVAGKFGGAVPAGASTVPTASFTCHPPRRLLPRLRPPICAASRPRALGARRNPTAALRPSFRHPASLVSRRHPPPLPRPLRRPHRPSRAPRGMESHSMPISQRAGRSNKCEPKATRSWDWNARCCSGHWSSGLKGAGTAPASISRIVTRIAYHFEERYGLERLCNLGRSALESAADPNAKFIMAMGRE